jgi:hypothetical protein
MSTAAHQSTPLAQSSATTTSWLLEYPGHITSDHITSLILQWTSTTSMGIGLFSWLNKFYTAFIAQYSTPSSTEPGPLPQYDLLALLDSPNHMISPDEKLFPLPQHWLAKYGMENGPGEIVRDVFQQITYDLLYHAGQNSPSNLPRNSEKLRFLTQNYSSLGLFDLFCACSMKSHLKLLMQQCGLLRGDDFAQFVIEFFPSYRKKLQEINELYSWQYNSAKIESILERWLAGELPSGDTFYLQRCGIRPLAYLGNCIEINLTNNGLSPHFHQLFNENGRENLSNFTGFPHFPAQMVLFDIIGTDLTEFRVLLATFRYKMFDYRKNLAIYPAGRLILLGNNPVEVARINYNENFEGILEISGENVPENYIYNEKLEGKLPAGKFLLRRAEQYRGERERNQGEFKRMEQFGALLNIGCKLVVEEGDLPLVSLYSCYNNEKIARKFTGAALQKNGCDLPSVLLELIAQYHCLDLPFVAISNTQDFKQNDNKNPNTNHSENNEKSKNGSSSENNLEEDLAATKKFCGENHFNPGNSSSGRNYYLDRAGKKVHFQFIYD